MYVILLVCVCTLFLAPLVHMGFVTQHVGAPSTNQAGAYPPGTVHLEEGWLWPDNLTEYEIYYAVSTGIVWSMAGEQSFKSNNIPYFTFSYGLTSTASNVADALWLGNGNTFPVAAYSTNVTDVTYKVLWNLTNTATEWDYVYQFDGYLYHGFASLDAAGNETAGDTNLSLVLYTSPTLTGPWYPFYTNTSPQADTPYTYTVPATARRGQAFYRSALQ